MTCKHFDRNLANGMHVYTMGCTSSSTKDNENGKPLPKTKQMFTDHRRVKDGDALRQEFGNQKVTESSREKLYENRKKRLLSDSSQQNSKLRHPKKKHNETDKALEMSRQLSLFQSPFDEQSKSADTHIYDVNISCHTKQLVWVEGILLPILEKELGLKCYLHIRDHIPGIPSVRNIAKAVEQSRLTILCFSKDYLTSSWQKYEALLAHHSDPGGWKKRILPIIVENCDLPFKYTIYATLKWADSGGSVPLPSVKLRRRFFFSSLLNALGEQNKETLLKIHNQYSESTIPAVTYPPQRYCFV